MMENLHLKPNEKVFFEEYEKRQQELLALVKQ